MLVQCDSNVHKKHKNNCNTPLLTPIVISLERSCYSINCGVDSQCARPNQNKVDLVDVSMFEKRKEQVCK